MPHLELAVSTCLFPAFDPATHLRVLADAGIGVVELAGGHVDWLEDEERFAELTAILEQTGVRVYSVHVPFSRTTDISAATPDQWPEISATAGICIRRLAELGGGIAVIHASSEPIEDEERPARLDQCRDALVQLASELPASGTVRLGVECLPRTCLGRDSAEHLRLLEQVGDDRVGICLDVNHANLREDLCEATRRYGDRILSLHLSDNDGVDERHWLPGKGIIDWQGWQQALADTGFSGPLTHEVSPWLHPANDPDASRMVTAIKQNAEAVFGLADERG